jgi:hypothetical protein
LSDFDFLKAGFYVRYWNPDTKGYEFYWLAQEEVQPSYIFKMTSVSAGSAGAYEEVKDLKPAAKHLFEFLMGFQAGCDFYVQVPAGTSLGGTDERKSETDTWRAVGFYNHRLSPFWNPSPLSHLFFAYWGNMQFYPAIKAYNPTDKTLQPRVRFVGKMFETEKITDASLLDRLDKRIIPWTPVSIGILAGKGRAA